MVKLHFYYWDCFHFFFFKLTKVSTHHIITRGFLVRLKVWTFHFYSSNLILFSNYTSTTWIVFILGFIVNFPLGLFSFFLTNKGYLYTPSYYREDCFHFGSLKSFWTFSFPFLKFDFIFKLHYYHLDCFHFGLRCESLLTVLIST